MSELACIYIKMSVTLSAPRDHPGGKHVLKMASSPDSVEERRRLQGRVRSQRYRDRQNENARAQRRQGDRDRRRAVCQWATETRQRPLEPPEERSVCTLCHRNNSLPALIFKQPSQHSNSQLAHTFVLQSAWSTLHMSLCEASLRMRMSSSSLGQFL